MEKPSNFLRVLDLRQGPDVRGILIVCGVASRIWFLVGRVGDWTLPYRLRTVEAQRGVVEEQWTGQGLVVRDESVVHTPATGRLTLFVAEGQQVRVGDIICEINAAGETGALPVSLEQIDAQMAAADEAIRAARREGAQHRTQLNEQLEELRHKINALQVEGKFEDVAKLETEQRTMEMRLRMAAGSEARAVLEAELRRQELLRQREKLLGRDQSDVFILRAASPGVISFQFDGLEELIPLDTPLHDVAAMRQIAAGKTAQSGGSHVIAGSPVFRLVNSHRFYLFVSLTNTGSLTVGETVRVQLANIELPMVISRVEERVDKVLALLISDSLLPELLNIRYTSVKVSRGTHQGVVIPLAGIISQKENQTGVYLMVEGRPVYRSIKVRGQDRKQAVVDGVPLGAKVVINPKLLVGD